MSNDVELVKEYGLPYVTDRFCRLRDSKKVFIVVGFVFPVLPAKNHTFTIMANAMRIGVHLKEAFFS